MREFKDTEGRAWQVTIDIAAAKRVRSLVGLDLMDISQGGAVQQLAADPILLCDALYVICKPQADKRQLSDEDFGRGLSGEVIERATTVFLEELADFFPGARRVAARKTLEAMQRVDGQLREALDNLDIDALVQQSCGDLLSKLPASSASTPTDTPTAT